MGRFLQGHLDAVVDYAEKYGVNIPLNEEETTPGRTLNGVQQQRDGSLATVSTEGKPVQVRDRPSEESARAQSSSGDDNLDLKKLIEESLSSHVPELKEPSMEPPASNGMSEFDSKNNLASFISEKLKTELENPAHGLPNMSTPGHGANVADSAHGKKRSSSIPLANRLTIPSTDAPSIHGPGESNSPGALSVIYSELDPYDSYSPGQRGFAPESVHADRCPLRKGAPGGCRQVIQHYAARRPALHAETVDP